MKRITGISDPRRVHREFIRQIRLIRGSSISWERYCMATQS
ncbi:MAG TPA: hypothetical protein VNQ76_10430 [Planctomicrobium sp.]|nr:hypothetical protein [Planctomicrobium sp.]